MERPSLTSRGWRLHLPVYRSGPRGPESTVVRCCGAEPSRAWAPWWDPRPCSPRPSARPRRARAVGGRAGADQVHRPAADAAGAAPARARRPRRADRADAHRRHHRALAAPAGADVDVRGRLPRSDDRDGPRPQAPGRVGEPSDRHSAGHRRRLRTGHRPLPRPAVQLPRHAGLPGGVRGGRPGAVGRGAPARHADRRRQRRLDGEPAGSRRRPAVGVPERPGRRHALVPRPHPPREPLQRVRGPGGPVHHPQRGGTGAGPAERPARGAADPQRPQLRHGRLGRADRPAAAQGGDGRRAAPHAPARGPLHPGQRGDLAPSGGRPALVPVPDRQHRELPDLPADAAGRRPARGGSAEGDRDRPGAARRAARGRGGAQPLPR